ncbi:hypothetical protein Dimus_024454 [Dionaea muscipula]
MGDGGWRSVKRLTVELKAAGIAGDGEASGWVLGWWCGRWSAKKMIGEGVSEARRWSANRAGVLVAGCLPR